MRKKVVAFLRGFGNLWMVCGLAMGGGYLLRHLLGRGSVELLAFPFLIGFYVLGVRFVEGLPVTDLRARDAAPGLSRGIVLGIALFSALMGILWVAGVYYPSGFGRWTGLAWALVVAIASASFEEVVFRGFLYRLIAALGGNWVALGVTAGLFGIAHLGNPHATWVSSLAIAIEAGILLGAAYAASGTLWLPIGIHAGWNFAEGPVFGMEVSGHAVGGGWIGGRLQGPEILTGGAFGPEASIVAVVVCLALAAFYLQRLKSASSVPAPAE
jgi:membrane protease YdiL (CAAX protease family)